MFGRGKKSEHEVTFEPNGEHGLLLKCSCGWEHAASELASAAHAKAQHLGGTEKDAPSQP